MSAGKRCRVAHDLVLCSKNNKITVAGVSTVSSKPIDVLMGCGASRASMMPEKISTNAGFGDWVM